MRFICLFTANLGPGYAGQEGLEPPTAGFGDRCSAKLSYCPRGMSPCGRLSAVNLAAAGEHLETRAERVPFRPEFQPATRSRRWRARLASTSAPAVAPATVAAAMPPT